MISRKQLAVILCCICNLAFGQEDKIINIEFDHFFGKQQLLLDHYYSTDSAGDSIKVNVLKYYISNIAFCDDSSAIWQEPESYYLLNVRDLGSLNLKLKVPGELSFNRIIFDLGIDSMTNSKGVKGGDLDPTKGMYWTWQSGYINFKIEGNSNLCKTRKNEFVFHLGGFQQGFDCVQRMVFETKKLDKIIILVDVRKLIESTDLAATNHIMSPGDQAKKMSVVLNKIFTISE